MRILPCNSFNNKIGSELPYLKRMTSNLSFTSKIDEIEKNYTPTEIELAKKYMRVKNAEKFIREEMNSSNSLISSAQQAIELMAKYRQYEISQGLQLKSLGDEINKIDKRSTDIIKRDKEIADELEKTGIKNAIDKIKLTKTITQEKRKKQVFDELDTKYIALHKLEEKSFPNAIMIKGMDDKAEQSEVIKYLENNNCKVFKLNFNNIPLEIAHKEINSCSKNIKNSGVHSILAIENFDKYTTPTDENFDFISRLKGFLCSCAKNYNTTVLVFESHPEKLDENIIGRHRFQKEIDVSNIKTGDFCEFVPKYDGYTLIYDDNENAHIDLFLSHFGTDKYTLWINSDDPNKIKIALDKLGKIKTIDRFKDIIFVQSPCPKSFSELDGYTYYQEKDFTTDYKRIYSYLI